jgi:hypothetical protein
MIVAKVWELQHVALVQRGADANALIRKKKLDSEKTSDQTATRENGAHTSGSTAGRSNSPATPATQPGTIAMRFSKVALKYLRSLGLAANAKKTVTMRFCDTLSRVRVFSASRLSSCPKLTTEHCQLKTHSWPIKLLRSRSVPTGSVESSKALPPQSHRSTRT